MHFKTISKLCCPFDKSDLVLTIAAQGIDENVLEGFLECEVCRRVYPIVKGIPIMNPDEYREADLERPLFIKWEKHLAGRKPENFRLE